MIARLDRAFLKTATLALEGLVWFAEWLEDRRGR